MFARNFLRLSVFLVVLVVLPAIALAEESEAPVLSEGGSKPLMQQADTIYRIEAISGSRLSPQIMINGQNHALAPGARLRWEGGGEVGVETLAPGMNVRVKTLSQEKLKVITELTIMAE